MAGVVLLLCGCGGGGGGGSAPSALISGTAASGAAVVGSVSVYDSSTQSQPAKTNIAIDGDGYYVVDVGGLAAPFLLEARGTVGASGPPITLYAAATAADVGGTINLTPFTNLMVLNIAGGDIAHWRASGGLRSLTATQLNAQNDAILTVLAPALAAMSLTDIDVLRETFSADNTGLDRFLDLVTVDAANPQAVTISHAEGGGTVTINSQAGGVILSGPTTLDPAASGTYTLSGTVSGLGGSGLVIQVNGDNLAILANGRFTFDKQLTTGASYFVSIVSQPTLSVCSIESGGAGTIGTANITSVAVACVQDAYTLSGTVSGLSGLGLRVCFSYYVENYGGPVDSECLPIQSNGTFTFRKGLPTGSSYSVVVGGQPTLSVCSVASGGTGIVGTANIISVRVSCGYTISGTVTGSGTADLGFSPGLVLLNNGSDPIEVQGSWVYYQTTFTFPTTLASGATYSVSVGTQPSGASCSVTSGGSGTATISNVSNVLVTCVPVFVDVPDVTGLDQEDATAAITAAGLAVGYLTRAYGPAVPAGAVVSQTPAAGSPVLPGTQINLVISPGLTPNAFTRLSATMTTSRVDHTATLLPSGRVLLTGGHGEYFYPVNDTAELYDPVAYTFTALSATMTTARAGHTATLLPSGQVLVTGGSPGDGAVNSAELYDPVANTFTALGATMTTARYQHTATLLPNGQVLLTGGGTPGGISNSAELYDPVANTFRAVTATMTTVRMLHTATVLPSGKVLLNGGYTGDGYADSAELYDPVANTFTALGARMTVAGPDDHTATLLPSGQVLLTGGAQSNNSAEMYDPADNTFTALSATMTTGRVGHAAALLPGGQVLLTGGVTDDYLQNSAELYVLGNQ